MKRMLEILVSIALTICLFPLSAAEAAEPDVSAVQPVDETSAGLLEDVNQPINIENITIEPCDDALPGIGDLD